LEHFGIEIDEEKQAYKYPVRGGYRYKAFTNGRSKYWHDKGVKNQLYGVSDVPASAPVVYFLNGEPAVWAAWQDGIPALCTFGEGAMPTDKMTGQLKELNPEVITVLPDNDEEGVEYGKKRREMLEQAGFKVRLLKPLALGKHADFADLHTSLNADKEAIREALEEQEEMPDEDLEELYKEQGLRPLEEILAECRGVKWVWDGLLREGTINILAAKPKVGKSNTLLNLAIEVSKGANFLGREAMRLPVVYYCVDEDPESINDRIKGRPYGDIRFTFTAPPLDSVLKLMQKKGQAFYVIDTLQRFLDIKDINDYSEVTNLLAPIQVKARETGSAVIFTHHGRKMEMEESKGDITLGSTALFGGVDTLLMMRIKDGERVICSSQRIGESMEETIVELDKDSGEVSVGGTLEEKMIRKAQEEIERILEGGRSLRTEEIKEEFKGDNTRLRKALRGMEEESKLSTEGKGKKGDPKRYYLK
jgi:hypothetical protein